MIEENIGATLFDRRRKPISLMPGVKALEVEIRDLSARLHKLRRALRASSEQVGQTVSFVCQHALTATVSPQIVRALAAYGGTAVRVLSGNQDECLMRLVSRDVDFAIMYVIPGRSQPEIGSAFDAVTVGADLLVPVCTPEMRVRVHRNAIPTIDYPPEVFLGQVVAQTIVPRLPEGTSIKPIAETALTLAMLQLVLSDIGIAWLPHSLIAGHLAQGVLDRVDEALPAQPLNIRLVRLSEAQTEQSEHTWQDLIKQLKSLIEKTDYGTPGTGFTLK